MQIIEQYSNYNHYDYNNPKFIIVHYVGADSTAKNNADYFCGGDRQASAHEFVDDNYCYKVIRENNGAWHIGNSVTEPNNTNSIGIEMCLVNGVVTLQTEANTLERVKYYMNKYNIPLENVRTHAEVTNYAKTCPNWSASNWSRWKEFKDKLVKNEEVKEEVKIKMKNAVCYCNETDERFAKTLRDYLGVESQALDARISMNWDKLATNIIAVGGDSNTGIGFSGYTTHKISGNNRYTTEQLILDICTGKRNIDEFKVK